MKLEQSQIAKLENFLEKIKSQTYPEPISSHHRKITHKMFAQFLKLFPLSPHAKILGLRMRSGCCSGIIYK